MRSIQESESHPSQSEHDGDPVQNGFRARLTAFFWAHDPRLVDKVEDMLAQHKGQEETYIQRVHMEYGERDFSGEVAVDDLYEHERYSYLSFSWGSSFPGHLLPTDRRRWSGLHGAPSSQTREKVAPQLPIGWEWTSEWEIDKTTSNCDEDGWIYAFDFTMLNLMVKRDGGRKDPKATDYVRRRRWIRRRQREATKSNNNAEEKIADTLDVDDEEGEDPGEEDDERVDEGEAEEGEEVEVEENVEEPTASERTRPVLSLPPLIARSAESATPASPQGSQGDSARPSLEYFSLTMDKASLDAAWNMAVKNLETIYSQANSHQTLKKKRWTVKKEKIKQQINLLEKTIASMQTFAQEEQLKRRHSSSFLKGKLGDLAPPAVKTPLSPDPKMSNATTASRVSPNDTTGINLASKLQCAQSKLDALKRMYWHPREKNYTLRFSIDGIFYGLRDFLVESLTSSLSIHLSHQTNGAQGITPTCKVIFKGHTVCCGKHVKVVGEKGTIVPKSLWDRMFLDTDFEATIYLIYVQDVDDERNPWLSDKQTGKWEFLFAPESTRVELTNFTRKTKGGVDLPEPVVRKLMSDVLSSLLRDLALLYVPPELAMAFGSPPAKLDMEADLSIMGAPIDAVMEREIELTSGKRPSEKKRAETHGDAQATAPSPSATVASPNTTVASPKPSVVSPKSPVAAAAPFVAVASVASATVHMLIGDDIDAAMRPIAELLELTPAQLNLLVALRQCGLYPAPYSFRSIATICAYYSTFFKQEIDKEDQGHVEKLRKTWKQVLELVYIKKMKAERQHPTTASTPGRTTEPGTPSSNTGSAAVSAPPPPPKYELFDMNRFLDRIAYLTTKPANIEMRVKRFYCTVDALCIVDAMAQLYERIVLGIDYSKPRVGNDQLLYGFRFGRKPKVSTAAARAAHAQSTQLLDPTIHLQMDATFRSRLKAFSQFCRALKSVIDLAKRNLDTVSVQVMSTLRGTGSDCSVRGGFREMDYTGPVNVSLHVPAMLLGLYRIETVPLSGHRVGVQIELLLPQKKKTASKRGTGRATEVNQVAFKAVATDFKIDVVLDVDALVEQHQQQRKRTASEVTAPWSPSASFTRTVESEKSKEPHCALSIAVNSTTDDGKETTMDGFEDENEFVIRIPSPTSGGSNTPTPLYGKVRLTSSAFTKLHVQAQSGTFETHLMPLLRLLFDVLRPVFLASFPEHQVLFDRIHTGLLAWLCSRSLEIEVNLLVKGFLHTVTAAKSNEESAKSPKNRQHLFVTMCGGTLGQTEPPPITFRDEVSLLDLILEGDDLINIWIDDRYPPYSSPLYF